MSIFNRNNKATATTATQHKWTAPGGTIPNLLLDMQQQPHILIAGCTKSGKSVLLNSFIYSIIQTKTPTAAGLILIDPKRVELIDYKDLPHTLLHATEPQQIYMALTQSVNIMESRYNTMMKLHQKESTEKDIYIIVDEFADLMTTQKKQTQPLLCRIAQMGRAAHIHLIIATQRPTRDIIDGQIKVNIDCRIALRCPTKQDSRNIINVGGAELLPRFGHGYYLTPETMQPVLYEMPYTPDEDIKTLCEYWKNQTPLFYKPRF